MIQVVYGAKGTGKTKRMIKMANEAVEIKKGSIVFLDDDKNYMYELNRAIRFIDVTEYPKMTPEMFTGFIYGLAAQDFDMEYIFVDGLLRMLRYPITDMENMFNDLSGFADKKGVTIVFSVSGVNDCAPEFLSTYII